MNFTLLGVIYLCILTSILELSSRAQLSYLWIVWTFWVPYLRFIKQTQSNAPSSIISYDIGKTLLSTVPNSSWNLKFSCLTHGNRNYFWPHVTSGTLLPLCKVCSFHTFRYFSSMDASTQLIYSRRTDLWSSLSLKLSPLQYLVWKNWATLVSMDSLQLSDYAVIFLYSPFLFWGPEHHSRQ